MSRISNLSGCTCEPFIDHRTSCSQLSQLLPECRLTAAKLHVPKGVLFGSVTARSTGATLCVNLTPYPTPPSLLMKTHTSTLLLLLLLLLLLGQVKMSRLGTPLSVLTITGSGKYCMRILWHHTYLKCHLR